MRSLTRTSRRLAVKRDSILHRSKRTDFTKEFFQGGPADFRLMEEDKILRSGPVSSRRLFRVTVLR